MVFKQVDDYIFKIIESSEIANTINNDTKIFIPNLNIKGNLYDENNNMYDSYIIGKAKNQIGLKIENAKYFYVQQKGKFVDSEEANIFINNSEGYSSKEFEESFKGVDFYNFYESYTNNFKRYYFLQIAESLLLLSYLNIVKNDDGKVKIIEISLNDAFRNFDFLHKKGFCSSPKKRERFYKITIPDNYHTYYNICDNYKEEDNGFFRRNMINNIYKETMDAYNEYYEVEENIKCCFNTVSEEIDKKFNRKDIDERC